VEKNKKRKSRITHKKGIEMMQQYSKSGFIQHKRATEWVNGLILARDRKMTSEK
jgi:hypothetical protein